MNDEYKSKVWHWLVACQYFDDPGNTFDFNAEGELLLNSTLQVIDARLNNAGAIPYNIGYCKQLSLSPGNSKAFLKFMNLETLPRYSQLLALHNLMNTEKIFNIEKEHFYDHLLINRPHRLFGVNKINADVIELVGAHHLDSVHLLPNTSALLFRNCNFKSLADISFEGATLEKLFIADCGLNDFKGFPKHVEELSFSTYKFLCVKDITELEKTNITTCSLSIPNLKSGILSIIEITKNIKVTLQKENTKINHIVNSFLTHDKPYEYIMDCTVLSIDSGLGDIL